MVVFSYCRCLSFSFNSLAKLSNSCLFSCFHVLSLHVFPFPCHFFLSGPCKWKDFPKSKFKNYISFLRDNGVLRSEPKNVIRKGVVVVTRIFQPFGGSFVYCHWLSFFYFNSFPLMPTHVFSVPSMPITFPCHFLISPFSGARFMKSKNYYFQANP